MIYRPDDGGTPREIKVPLMSILARKAPDISLRPGDVLYVPSPPLSEPVIDDRLIEPDPPSRSGDSPEHPADLPSWPAA